MTTRDPGTYDPGAVPAWARETIGRVAREHPEALAFHLDHVAEIEAAKRHPRHHHREPRLRRRPCRRTRTPWEPALTRQSRQELPAAGLRHPHRQAPRPAGPDGLQCGTVGHRRRPRLHLPLGSRALAAAAAGTPPPGDRSPRSRAGDRATRARAPGQAPRDREPPRPSGGGTASPGATPDHPGSHPAPRPTGLPGPRQATRQPTTVRGRRLDRTISC